MSLRRSRSRGGRLLAVMVGLGMGVSILSAAPASATASHALIQGSGSSWSANAINQWIADVQSSGLQVVYTASGSAQGRKDFGYLTTDFAVSEIGYQGVDPLTHDPDTSNGRAYAYLPIVAGGTSFPYQIKVAGQLVRNLRLSGETLAKIFTNKITNWDDPEITADNNGRKLPSIAIIPVVHSEGSGSSAQLTKYFDAQYPSIWRPFLGAPGFTEYFPRKGIAIAQNGSDGVMNFISSAAANGAIGYDEYSYALGQNYPVAKVLNSAGYYALPTQYNVAVALTRAQINMDKTSPDYLLQNLNSVYTYSDPRTYPLSSYSYAIIPTAANDQKMTTAKRQTITDFLYYSICEGQKEMGPIGYSPLPINLVQAGFDQIGKLKTADPGVDLTQRSVATCNNPTFIAGQPTRNHLAEIAPLPPSCDKTGQGPCGSGSGTAAGGTSGVGAGTANASSGATAASTAGRSAGPTAVGGAVDPTTGLAQGSDTASGGAASAVPVELAAYRSPNLTGVLAPLAAALLLLILVGPPLVARRLAAQAASAKPEALPAEPGQGQ
jgi:phosphate transport system substrate-binding protein